MTSVVNQNEALSDIEFAVNADELISKLQFILTSQLQSEQFSVIQTALAKSIGLKVTYNGSMVCSDDSCEIIDENATETKVEFDPALVEGGTSQVELIRSLLVTFVVRKDNQLDLEEAQRASETTYDL